MWLAAGPVLAVLAPATPGDEGWRSHVCGTFRESARWTTISEQVGSFVRLGSVDGYEGYGNRRDWRIQLGVGWPDVWNWYRARTEVLHVPRHILPLRLGELTRWQVRSRVVLYRLSNDGRTLELSFDGIDRYDIDLASWAVTRRFSSWAAAAVIWLWLQLGAWRVARRSRAPRPIAACVWLGTLVGAAHVAGHLA